MYILFIAKLYFCLYLDFFGLIPLIIITILFITFSVTFLYDFSAEFNGLVLSKFIKINKQIF